MNILIDLLQPHSEISNGIELATENDDMIAGKNTIFRKVRREWNQFGILGIMYILQPFFVLVLVLITLPFLVSVPH
jgi:hypothetical protein